MHRKNFRKVRGICTNRALSHPAYAALRKLHPHIRHTILVYRLVILLHENGITFEPSKPDQSNSAISIAFC